MSIINSVSDAIDKLYQNFILRDFFGFVLPGAFSFISILYHITNVQLANRDFFQWIQDCANYLSEITSSTGFCGCRPKPHFQAKFDGFSGVLSQN